MQTDLPIGRRMQQLPRVTLIRAIERIAVLNS